MTKTNKKERLNACIDRFVDSADILADDIYSLLDNHNITKARIAKDLDSFENKILSLKNALKFY